MKKNCKTAEEAQTQLTEIVFLLDRSGSMAGLESDTVGGFNAMLRKQREECGGAYVTTLLFDDRCQVLHDRMDIRQVSPMTEKEYFVRGSTALLDALGGAISRISAIHSGLAPEQCPSRTVFIITTDGMENASREYRYPQVKAMVSKMREKEGWEFLFLGANMDAIAAAGRFGIGAERAVRYTPDAKGVELNFRAVGAAISAIRKNKTLDCSWKESIETDFEERGF